MISVEANGDVSIRKLLDKDEHVIAPEGAKYLAAPIVGVMTPAKLMEKLSEVEKNRANEIYRRDLDNDIVKAIQDIFKS